MKKNLILFFKVVILLIATGTLIWIIKFPQLEGRAAGLDLVSIYTDPFIIYGYVASIPFFIGLYQVFKLLNFIDNNKTFSQGAVNTLRNIKFASISLVGFITAGVFYIRFLAHGEDPAGPTMLGILVSFAAAVIAPASAVFQKNLQGSKKLKSVIRNIGVN